MGEDQSGANLAGKMVKGDVATNGEREPVNPSATGAAVGATVIKQTLNASKSTYSGMASKN